MTFGICIIGAVHVKVEDLTHEFAKVYFIEEGVGVKVGGLEWSPMLSSLLCIKTSEDSPNY